MNAYLEELFEHIETIAFSMVVAFLVTVFFIWVLYPLAQRLDLVDHPSNRKKHIGSVPLIGGISMYLGFIFSVLTLNVSFREYRSFLAGAGLLVIVGILDDFQELTPKKKFAAQVLAIMMLMSWGNIMITELGALIPGSGYMFPLGDFSWPFTFIMAIAIINAVNMSDGLDGLAGGYVLVALLGILILIGDSAAVYDTRILLVLIPTVAGFMIFNMRTPWLKKAYVFMGDAGSMFLGLVLVWFFISLSQGDTKYLNPVTVLWLVAVPAFDLVGVTLRRLLQKKHIFEADCGHFHHVFRAAGMSVEKTVIALLLISIFFAAIGVLGQHYEVSEGIMFSLFMFCFVVYFVGMQFAWKHVERIEIKNKH